MSMELGMESGKLSFPWKITFFFSIPLLQGKRQIFQSCCLKTLKRMKYVYFFTLKDHPLPPRFFQSLKVVYIT